MKKLIVFVLICCTIYFGLPVFFNKISAETNGIDLIVNNISINSDTSGYHIIVTVKNTGNQTLVMNKSVILKLTLGTNTSEIQSCDTTGSMPCAVGNEYNAGIAVNAYGKTTLSPGEEYNITFDNKSYLLEKVEFNSNADYLIRAMVDWTDMIEESNENNNTLTKSYTPNLPDLVVSNITVNSDSSGNHIVVTIKNIGSQNSNLNSGLKVTYGTNISAIESCAVGYCDVGNTYIGGIYPSAYGKTTLSPGEEYNITFDNKSYLLSKVVFNNNENYLIKAIVDDNKIISESNENNNTLTKSYTPTPTISWINGQWIKTNDSTTVYFVDSNNVRHAYPNNAIWRAYFGDDFSFVQTVTNNDLTKYSLGKNVPYKSEMLIKIPSVPKVYKVGDNGTIQWIKTEATAKRLFGDDWTKLVHDLDESFFGDYTEGTSIE